MAGTDKRRLILEALEKVLQGKRLDEVRVEEVAEAAGVGKGTVYLYFEDKEDLFLQMIQEMLLTEADDIAVVAASTMEPREKLLRMGEMMSRHVMRKGRFIRMMMANTRKRKHGDPRTMMKEHHQRLDRILRQVFEDAAKSGILSPKLNYGAAVCLFKGMILQQSIDNTILGSACSVNDLLDLLLIGAGKDL
jgi:AcrR family transcriptional regulator